MMKMMMMKVRGASIEMMKIHSWKIAIHNDGEMYSEVVNNNDSPCNDGDEGNNDTNQSNLKKCF